MDRFFLLPISSFATLFAQANAATGEPDKEVAWYVMLMVALAVLAVTVIPFVLGDRLAKALRMNDYGWKLGLIFATIVSATTVVIVKWPPKLGIDLSGGTVLVYEIDPLASAQMQQTADEEKEGEQEAAEAQEINVDELVPTLKKRIDPGGVREIVVRRYGPKQIEIIIPNMSASEVAEIMKKIHTAGHLRFRIAADTEEDDAICLRADDPSQEGQPKVKDRSGKRIGEWVRLGKDQFSPGEIAEFKTRMNPQTGDVEVLMLIDPFNVEGEHLAGARFGYDSRLSPCVNFAMNGRGSALFGALTGANIPDRQTGFRRKLGIVMDNELLSAPFINDRITSQGQITGRFEKEEVEFLVGILKAGRLPAALRKDPISQNQISSMLGADTIRKGKIAIGISLVSVLVFMLFYYRFSGIVACLAVIANLILIFALMLLPQSKVALTLPGLAGLVLTVGMSVDANVLIFERIREELTRGAALRMALRNGFARATTTIVDANLTTFITAIVLYVIGTEQIRGFAVTLILGILMSMYTAIFCSRVLFDIAERKRWITKLSMMRILGETHIDFIGKTRIAAACSIALIAIGLTAAFYRGRDILDIDFNGGTSVQILLKEPMPIDEVRRRVNAEWPDAWVTGVDIEGKTDEVYKVDTPITGFGDIGTIRITDRSGKSATIDLSQATMREDIIRAIKAAKISISVGTNEQGDGIQILDISDADQSNFMVASVDDGKGTAEKLGIVHDSPERTVDSGRLPGSVYIVEQKLKEIFSDNGVSLLVLHDMQFEPPVLLAAADTAREPEETTPPVVEPDATDPAAADDKDAGEGETEGSGDATDAARPKASDDARSDLPGSDVLVFASNDLMLLAQAEPGPEGESDAPGTADTPAAAPDTVADPPDADNPVADDPPPTVEDPPATKPVGGEAPAEPEVTPDDPVEEDTPADEPAVDAAPQSNTETPDAAPEASAPTDAADASAPPAGDAGAGTEAAEEMKEPEGEAEEPAKTTETDAKPPEDAKPAEKQPPTAEPPAEQPTTEQPTTEQPTAEQPTAEQPTTEQPTTEQPTAEQPTAEQPTTEQPTTEQPPTEQPPTEEPPTEQPPTEQPPEQEAPADEEPSTLISQTTLTFDEPINAESVASKIDSVADSLEVSRPAIKLTAEGWDGQSSKGFSVWTLQSSADPEQTAAILGKIRDELAQSPVWPSSSQIGSAVAGKMQNMALAALLTSLVGIVAYIWFRFQKVMYGLAAVVALLHDVSITLGAIALSYWLAQYFGFLMIDNFKISLAVVAAFLTIVGYSLNDTIVVFDRIREVKGKSPDLTADIINTSINQTLSRTLLTSATTLLVVLILYILGGQGIHAFAFCLLIGVLVGTYSSVFVASPFLLWMTGGRPALKSDSAQAASM